MNIVTKSVEIGGKTITFETGKLAKQASGAVVVRCGESHVLVTVVCQPGEKEFDFFPLTVNYEDRNGASGSIPGGYLKRETGRSERETLICRVVDRPLRPMFPKNYREEVQILATSMSFELDNPTDVLSICGASAAVHISSAPMVEPIAGVRVCRVDGQLVLNPNAADRAKADLNLVIAGSRSAITMVEGGAKEVEESVVLDALDLAQQAIAKICACIDELRAEVGVPKRELPPVPQPDATAAAAVEAHLPALRQALSISGKHERRDGLKAALNEALAKLVEGKDEAEAARLTAAAKEVWEKKIRAVMRGTVLDEQRRIDGRQPDGIRPIWCEVSVSPRAHGSAIFTRGETQGFVTLALGTDQDIQRLELPGKPNSERRFMLTYNFPPFCTGEARPLRGPKRREIGHGALARRALLAVLPDQEAFPYVLRSTSEILESNGSSSMATVCGTTLALMDAGVPIKAPVAGIAMGLIKEGERFAVLSDILGDEDHLGDMDFKVTGTRDGITAFQMDVKITEGVNRAIMTQALQQAKAGRVHILDEMAKTLEKPRADLSRYAPRITTLYIKPDKIRDVIGPGGKVIRSIQDACEVKIKVEDSGRVDVASSNEENTAKAIAMIREITQEAEIGALYVGVVKRITDFGAFVEIFPGTDGLIHISHLAKERVEKVTDVVQEGDEVLVRVIDVDRAGKVRLSRKEALDAGT